MKTLCGAKNYWERDAAEERVKQFAQALRSVCTELLRVGDWQIDKGIKKTQLKTLAGVSINVIAKLGKNDPVSMETLAKICAALNCDIADIVEMTSHTGNGGK